ncbi:MAG TPA: DUF2089 domain-containing protein [Anaerolineales bacterium]|nr:DUF2089 domain-containing protein [Anaerolineales bacterium]
MRPVIGTCPVCGEALTVTRLHCRSCDTTIEGQFALGAFERLTPEQLAFMATFIKCDGKLNRMESEMGLSYPTLRARLNELRRAMGFEIMQDEAAPAGVSDEERRVILDDIAAGRLTSEEAVKRLQGG